MLVRNLFRLAAAAAVAVWAGAAAAQVDDVIESGPNKLDYNAGTIMIMTTRSLGSPFMQMALDLSNVLDAGEGYQDMRIVPVVARGKVQNLWDILYLRGIDAGFIQSDILEYLKDDPRISSIKRRIRYIAVMFPEEVHIIASNDIRTLEDLNGKKISINAKGTGSEVVGRLLTRRLGIDAELINEDTRQAVARIKSGELAAHFNVLGKPTPVVGNIKSEGKLHLLPIPYTDAMADVYLPSTLTHEDYPNLIAEGETVPTLAVGNVLATFNWPEDNYRGQKVKKFVDSFFASFEELKKDGYDPHWKNVNLNATIPGWQRLKAAQDWLDAHPPEVAAMAGGDKLALKQEFNAFMAQSAGGAATASLSEDQVDALFEQFIRWRQTQ